LRSSESSPGAAIKVSRFLTENSSEPQKRTLNLLHGDDVLNPLLECRRCLHVDTRRGIVMNM